MSCCLTIAHCTHVDAIISCCRHHHRRFSCNSGSIVTVTVVVAVAPLSSPTRWVSSSQLSSSAVVAAVGQYITRDAFANHIGQRVSLSAGRPGQFALESCDPLTECVRHNCDCLLFVSSVHWSVGCIMTVNSARVYWGVPVLRAKACGDAQHVRDDHDLI